DRTDDVGITVRHGEEQGPGSQTVRAQTMQDRPLETGAGGIGRLCVKRIAVEVQTIEKCLFGSGDDVDLKVRGGCGAGASWFRRLSEITSEHTIRTSKGRMENRDDGQFGPVIKHGPRSMDDCALLPFVFNTVDTGMSKEIPLRRQGLMHENALLAVNHSMSGDSKGWI